MKKRLSIVMPFRNEGLEPERTVRSILATAPPDSFEVIAVEDGTNHYEDGRRLTRYPQVRHFRTETCTGVDGCRQLGVSLAESENVLIIDAHMRFRADDWLPRIEQALEEFPRCVFCTTCVDIGWGHFDLERVVLGETELLKKYRGARLSLFARLGLDARGATRPQGFPSILDVWPIEGPEEPGSQAKGSSPIPCIIGANYAVKRDWYESLHGVRGLLSWGGSESFLSLKSHLAGGACRLLPDIEIGHLFRASSPNPFPIEHYYYNKVLMARVLFPGPFAQHLVELLGSDPAIDAARAMARRNAAFIAREASYFQSLPGYRFPEPLRSAGLLTGDEITLLPAAGPSTPALHA
jgi:glycosyltransferase involved in cell wall biosynthesis